MTSGPEPLTPAEGLGVLHLFCRVGAGADAEAFSAAIKAARANDLQVIPLCVFGHKADLGVMALGSDWVKLRGLQTAVSAAGFDIAYSYVSLTEVNEYAKGMPPEHLQARLYPVLPPTGKRAFCFYPMSKRRGETDNWYSMGYDERRELMLGHGKVGRTFAGRVVQLITGSTGLDDYEWGVSLFATGPDDLKDAVYTMRFDDASARFAEFGPFYTGIVGEVDEVLAFVGLASP